MPDKKVTEISPSQLSDAIDIIARAEQRSRVEMPTAGVFKGTPGQVESIPVQNHLAPQGLAEAVDVAMGPIHLPRLIDLHSAILKVRDNLAAATNLPDELSATAIGVLDEETLKIDRYLALGKR